MIKIVLIFVMKRFTQVSLFVNYNFADEGQKVLLISPTNVGKFLGKNKINFYCRISRSNAIAFYLILSIAWIM